MENTEVENQTPNKSKRIIWIAGAVVGIIIIGIVAYVLLNLPKEQAVGSATPAPQIPSKSEVTQIMTSVDNKIEQASADQASASAALKEASTPVKVDL